MNLVIDIGNTTIKIGVFNGEKLVFKIAAQLKDFEEVIVSVLSEYQELKKAIIASVGKLSQKKLNFLQKKIETLVLDEHVSIPFKNLYSTPHTLGVDRIALIAAAVYNCQGQNVLVIDAGTCITYDFKNKNDEYLGGAISPGIHLRYSSLHTHTAKLPKLSLIAPDQLTGDGTINAIHSGVVNGVVYEIDGVIEEYCNIYGDLTVILTGGDAHFLSKRLKNSIFATSNFLLEGLNYILAFNNTQ
ncbi:type III pantothenate kinase [Aquimarina sp. 2-A2]|uniref:type III pantothenate kinase n=1 Tax=Aquimarina sp. 2-A2 TaxID=3382644 RepID=UPI00387F11A4